MSNQLHPLNSAIQLPNKNAYFPIFFPGSSKMSFWVAAWSKQVSLVFFPSSPEPSRGLWPMLLRRRRLCVSERRCRGVPSANLFFRFGGGKAGRYEIPVDGRNPPHQLRGSFKGGNFKPCLFPFLGK